jgi:lysophospholipase L1-like esterase
MSAPSTGFELGQLTSTPDRIPTMTSTRLLLILPVFLGLLFISRVTAQDTDLGGPIRVACVGDSITAGVGASSPDNAYPMQLQRMLRDGYKVGNFGNSGKTLLEHGDYPYWTTDTLQQALAFKPNIVTIMLGTNDTKPQNWKLKDQFTSDYKDLIAKFQALTPKPKIFLVRPSYIPGDGNYGINEPAMREELAIIDSLAMEEGLPTIDVHAATAGKDSAFVDRVHPNNQGAYIIAQTLYQALTGSAFTGTADSIILSK